MCLYVRKKATWWKHPSVVRRKGAVNYHSKLYVLTAQLLRQVLLFIVIEMSRFIIFSFVIIAVGDLTSVRGNAPLLA